MSMRGVATGWAGSAAVLMIAATSLGAVRAEADVQTQRKVTAPLVLAPARPVADHAAKPPAARPAWLRRLLSPSDLEPAHKPG